VPASSSAAAASSQRSAWAQAANRICRDGQRQARRFGKPPVNDLDGTARWLAKLLPYEVAQTRRLARLPRPAADRLLIRRWIALEWLGVAETRRLIRLLRAHDLVGVARVGRRSVERGRQANRLARRLGATDCAS
jgi:hypothetical protein